MGLFSSSSGDSSSSGYGGGGGRGTGADGGGFSSSSGDNWDRSHGNYGRSDATTSTGSSGFSGSGSVGGTDRNDATTGKTSTELKQQLADWIRENQASDFQREQAAARQPAGQQTGAMMEANEVARLEAIAKGEKVGGALGSTFGPLGSTLGSAFGGWSSGQAFDPQVIPGASPQSLTSDFAPPSGNAGGYTGSSGFSGSGSAGIGGGGGSQGGLATGLLGGYQGVGDNRSPGQIEMDRQNAFLQYAGGLYHPGMQRGEEASQALFDYYSGNQAPMQQQVSQSVMNSPFLAQNIALGEDAIARNRQATGGFRTGTTQENLAQNSQQQYQNLYNQQLNQRLQGLGGFSDQGANQLNQYANFGQGMINDIGTTAGSIESQNIAREANKQNQQNAILGAIGGAVGSYFGS